MFALLFAFNEFAVNRKYITDKVSTCLCTCFVSAEAGLQHRAVPAGSSVDGEKSRAIHPSAHFPFGFSATGKGQGFLIGVSYADCGVAVP